MVEVEKLVYVQTKSEDDCECISEVNFVTLWNKLMTIKLQENSITENCVSNERFLELLANNIQRNFGKAVESLPAPKKPAATK